LTSDIGCRKEEDRKTLVDSGLRPLLPRTHENQLSEGCPRAPDGLEQTGIPELIPGPRIRSYDARPNSFLNGHWRGAPCTSLGRPLVRPDLRAVRCRSIVADSWLG